MSDEQFLDMLHAHPELWNAFMTMLKALDEGATEQEARHRAYAALPPEVQARVVPAW